MPRPTVNLAAATLLLALAACGPSSASPPSFGAASAPVSGSAVDPGNAGGNKHLTVMSRNLYLGADLGPVIGAILFSSFFTFLENTLVQAVNADLIPTSLMTTNQVGIVRFILVGVLLMALMIFRPQGIFGDKKELALDAR